jgi:hypothetical protein
VEPDTSQAQIDKALLGFNAVPSKYPGIKHCRRGGRHDETGTVRALMPIYGSTRAEQVERCRREVESCRRAGANPNLTPAEKLGAMQGEVDWLVALQITEED